MTDSKVVFTICNIRYMPKALVLAESLLKFEGVKLTVFIADRKRSDVFLPLELANFIWVEELNLPFLFSCAFKYDVTELCTALKPFITMSLMKENEFVVFLDPDTCLFHSLAPVYADLKNHDIVLTPHYLKPILAGDLGMMRFGSFNLGFYAVKNSANAVNFLEWWHERCLDLCFFETQWGLSTDQKWVSIAPCFFDLHISFNVGLNVAFWNVHERVLSKVNAQYFVNNEVPLIFFHFSSFDAERPELLSSRPFKNKEKRERILWN